MPISLPSTPLTISSERLHEHRVELNLNIIAEDT